MGIRALAAVATTFRIEPGSETADDSGVHVRSRVFTDRVESADMLLDGTNRVTVNLDISPDGSGQLVGAFELTLADGRGAWHGELSGHLEGGLVVSRGLGRGSGDLEQGCIYIEFRQIEEHPGTPSTEQAFAFFRMQALALLPA